MTPPDYHEEKTPHGSICTRSGERFYPFEPRGVVRLEDIAWATAHKVRFTGHMLGLYTVAQHQVHVSEVVEVHDPHPLTWLQALLHDASEAYLPDVASPLKAHLVVSNPGVVTGPAKATTFREVESRLLAYIFHCLGLGGPPPAVVKDADLGVFFAEKRDLMPDTDWWDVAEAEVGLTSSMTPAGPMKCWAPSEAYLNWIDRLHYCLAALDWQLPPRMAAYFRAHLTTDAGLVSMERAYEVWHAQAMTLLTASLRV